MIELTHIRKVRINGATYVDRAKITPPIVYNTMGELEEARKKLMEELAYDYPDYTVHVDFNYREIPDAKNT